VVYVGAVVEYLAAERVGSQVEQLEDGIRLIEGALQLLHDPSDMYLRMPPEGRRKMNEAVFEKLYVHDGVVTEVVFQVPFGDLMGAQEIVRESPMYERKAPWPEIDWSFSQVGSENFSEDLAGIFLDDGLSRGLLVRFSRLGLTSLDAP
jgi:hypothetical protein